VAILLSPFYVGLLVLVHKSNFFTLFVTTHIEWIALWSFLCFGSCDGSVSHGLGSDREIRSFEHISILDQLVERTVSK